METQPVQHGDNNQDLYSGNTRCYACEEIPRSSKALAYLCMCFHEEAPHFRGLCGLCVEHTDMAYLRTVVPTGHRLKSCLSEEDAKRLYALHVARDREHTFIAAAVCLLFGLAYYMGWLPLPF